MYLQIRVDQRLIHGQVTQGWAEALALQWIVVISEALAHNLVAQKIRTLGVPDGLQVAFVSASELATRWSEWEGEHCNTLILTDNLDDVVYLLESHGSLPNVTLGNLHGEGACHSLTRTVYCTDGEMQAIHTLLERKVVIRVCSGVGDEPVMLPVKV